MATQLLFTFSEDIGPRVPRPGQIVGKLRVSVDTVSGAYLVEEATDGTNWQTRATAAQIVKPYNILVGQRSTYAPCVGSDLHEYFASATFPYVALTVTANSPFCQVGTSPDGIFLDIDVYAETLPGENDGKIVATATTLQPVTSYKVFTETAYATGGIFATPLAQNTPGIFPGLSPGKYFVSVANTGGAFTVKEAIIGAGTFAEYGLYAQVHTGTTRHNRPLLLKVRKKGYTGGVYEAKMMDDDSFRLSWSGTSTDWLFSYINGLALDFTLYGEYLRDWSILYTQDDREYLIEVEHDNTLVFRGYLLPEFFESPYIQFPHGVSLVASDGLGQLKSYLFVNKQEKPYTGVYTVEAVLNLCLDKVNLNIPLYHSIDWAFGTLTNGADVFGSMQIDVGVFYKIKADCTCADVVQMTLEAFAARLMQVEGVFLIHQPYSPLTTSTFTAYHKGTTRTFKRAADSACSDDDYDNILLIDQSNTGVFPGTRNQLVTETMYPVGGLVRYSNLQLLEAWEAVGTAPRLRPAIRDWMIGDTLIKPVVGYTTYVQGEKFVSSQVTRSSEGSQVITSDMCDGIVFVSIRTRSEDAKLIQLPLGDIFREQPTQSDAELGFLIYLKIKTLPVNSDMAFNIGLVWVGDNGVTYRMYSKLNSWDVASASNPAYLTYIIAKSDTGRDKEISYTTPVLPLGWLTTPTPTKGVLRLEISEPYVCVVDSDGNILPGDPKSINVRADSTSSGFTSGPRAFSLTDALTIQSVQVKPLIGGNELASSRPWEYVNKGDYITEYAKSELRLGSHYYGKNNERFYPYAWRDLQNKAITYWRDIDGNSYHMGEILMRELVKARKIIRPFTSAVLKGRMQFYQRLKMLVDNDIEYFPAEMTWDLVNEEYSGKFIYALGEYSLPYYRLNEDGTPKLQENGETFRTFEGRTFDEANTTQLE